MTGRPAGTRRPFSIRAYLVFLVVVICSTAGVAAWFVEHQTARDARSSAVADAAFAATTAGKELGDYVTLVQATVRALATNPRITQTFKHPTGCTLSFNGIGGPDQGHVDIIAPDGTVACSSRPHTAAQPASYADAAWIGRALTGPLFIAPTLDRLTGASVAVSTMPIPGGTGFVAGFVDLSAVGPALARLYSGGHEDEFMVTTSNGRIVIARSLEPKKWIGRSLAGTAFARSAGSDQHRDLDGTNRFYANVKVPGVAWRFSVGENAHAALAPAERLEYRELAIVLSGLAAALIAAFLVLGRVVGPVRRLSRELRATSFEPVPSLVAVDGPAELLELGEDINGLISSVNRGMLERRQADETVAASERKYRLLFEANPSPMWVFDAETLRFLAVNEAAVKSYGFTRGEFLAMTIEEIRPPEDVASLRSFLGSSYADGAELSASGLWRHRRKDGTVFDVEISSHEHEFEGRPARVLLALDVTERVEGERAVRRSEARYRDLFENATDLIATVDLDSRFTAVNGAFTRTLGYTSAELIGRPLGSIVPEEWHDQLGLARDGKMDGALSATVYAHELLAKDGRRIQVEVASRVIEEDGHAVGIEAICRDVSERRHLEDQLRQAQRLEGIGRLAGGVAHDFNNLLTVISGYTEALIEQGHASPGGELTEIAAAAERAAILTRQLLAFSRRQVLKPQVVSVNAIVEGITPMLVRLIGEDVDLVAALDPDAAAVLADPNQLEQVLVNLVVNARDAMPGGGKLTVETGTFELDDEYVATHPEATAGWHTMLAISDTGMGMSNETLSHVFEPFFTTKPAGEGTGLGLSTVYGIVKQSGGSIWVYTEPSHGTTVKVYLPAVAQTAAPAGNPRAGAAAPNGTETILLVEDEAPLRQLVTEQLRARGYTVLAADDGAHARRLAAENTIDLLLTDVVMPKMSGRELSEHVCAESPTTRVLFMSGYADEAVVRNGSLNPGATFLEKPFSSAELASRVRKTLDETREPSLVD